MGACCSSAEVGAAPDKANIREHTRPEATKPRGATFQTHSSLERSDNDADAGVDSDLDKLPPLPKEEDRYAAAPLSPLATDPGSAAGPTSVTSMATQPSDTPEPQRISRDGLDEAAPAQAPPPKTLKPSLTESQKSASGISAVSSTSSLSSRRDSPYPQPNFTPQIKSQDTHHSLIMSPLVEESTLVEEEAPVEQPRKLSVEARAFKPQGLLPILASDTKGLSKAVRRLSGGASPFKPRAGNNVVLNVLSGATQKTAFPTSKRWETDAACNENRCVFLKIPGGRNYRNPKDYSATIERVTKALQGLGTQPTSCYFPQGTRIGFVSFDSTEAAQNAINKLSGTEIMDSAGKEIQLSVDMARPRIRRGATRTGNRRRGNNRRRDNNRGGGGREWQGDDNANLKS